MVFFVLWMLVGGAFVFLVVHRMGETELDYDSAEQLDVLLVLRYGWRSLIRSVGGWEFLVAFVLLGMAIAWPVVLYLTLLPERNDRR